MLTSNLTIRGVNESVFVMAVFCLFSVVCLVQTFFHQFEIVTLEV